MLKNAGSAPQEAGMRSQGMPGFPVIAQSSPTQGGFTAINHPQRASRILQNQLIRSTAPMVLVTLHTLFVASIA
jgi:hypothetical protein